MLCVVCLLLVGADQLNQLPEKCFPLLDRSKKTRNYQVTDADFYTGNFLDGHLKPEGESLLLFGPCCLSSFFTLKPEGVCLLALLFKPRCLRFGLLTGVHV